jgi:hypothetical protein
VEEKEMTWREFKQHVEDKGVKDYHEVDYIDYSDGKEVEVEIDSTEARFFTKTNSMGVHNA